MYKAKHVVQSKLYTVQLGCSRDPKFNVREHWNHNKYTKKEQQENTTEKTKASVIARAFDDFTGTHKQGTLGSTSLKFILSWLSLNDKIK